jgi:TatD DNase family protein
LVDSHVHLLSRQFNRDRGLVIERAFAAGIEFMVEVATDTATGVLATKLARSFQNIYASVGIHPHDARTVDDTVLRRLDELAGEPGVVAIGETGLDFYRDLSPRDVQKRVFVEHIALAKRKHLPLVVHIRGAYPEALETLETEDAAAIGGVLHCFSGNIAEAERALKMGFALGFGGSITYGKRESEFLVSAVPLESMLLETDAPYLGPGPYRKERNEPAYVSLVLDAVAAMKRIPKDRVDEVTSSNARRLFRVDAARERLRAGPQETP